MDERGLETILRAATAASSSLVAVWPCTIGYWNIQMARETLEDVTVFPARSGSATCVPGWSHCFARGSTKVDSCLTAN